MAGRMTMVAVVLGWFAAAAQAGPIEWSYTFSGGTPTNAPYLYLGQASRVVDTPGGPVTDTRRAYNAVSPVSLTGTHIGNLTVGSPVGGVTYPVLDVIAAPPRTADSTWLVTVGITDTASGQIGSATFTWTPWVDDTVFTSGGPGVVGWETQSQSRTLILGENRYTLRTFAEDRESGSPLMAEVTATANAPEPGTLLMAVCGLALPAGRWVRRRREVK